MATVNSGKSNDSLERVRESEMIYVMRTGNAYVLVARLHTGVKPFVIEQGALATVVWGEHKAAAVDVLNYVKPVFEELFGVTFSSTIDDRVFATLPADYYKIDKDEAQVLHDNSVLLLDSGSVRTALEANGFTIDCDFSEIEADNSMVLPYEPRDIPEYNDWAPWQQQLIDQNYAYLMRNGGYLKKGEHPRYWKIIEDIKDGVVTRILTYGPPGSGKTHAHRLIAGALAPGRGFPVASMNMNTNSDESTIIAEYKPYTEDLPGWVAIKNPFVGKGTASQPKFILIPSVHMAMFQYGGYAVYEELNLAPAGPLGILNTGWDNIGFITLPDGTQVPRHPLHIVGATLNPGLDGTERMNDATVDRFDVNLKFKVMTADEFKQVIKSKIQYKNVNVLNRVYDLWQDFNASSEAGGFDRYISIRGIENFLIHMVRHGDAVEAFEVTCLNKIFVDGVTDEDYDAIIKSVSKPLKAIQTAFKAKSKKKSTSDKKDSFIVSTSTVDTSAVDDFDELIKNISDLDS